MTSMKMYAKVATLKSKERSRKIAFLPRSLTRIVESNLVCYHKSDVKARLSGGDDLFYKWTNAFFSFGNVSFIALGVPLTSTANTLLNLMIVLSLFYADLNDTCCQSSIKLTPRPGLRKNLHSPRITALRLRTSIITLFTF